MALYSVWRDGQEIWIDQCRTCGRHENIALLDAKPEHGADPATSDWTRLECVACYGADYAVAGSFDDSVSADLDGFYEICQTSWDRHNQARRRLDRWRELRHIVWA